jgi:hypothetical protein
MMEGVNSTMIYLLYCKKFCKCHNVSPAQLKTKQKMFPKHPAGEEERQTYAKERCLG